jgi:hypothetical protein
VGHEACPVLATEWRGKQRLEVGGSRLDRGSWGRNVLAPGRIPAGLTRMRKTSSSRAQRIEGRGSNTSNETLGFGAKGDRRPGRFA